MFDATPETTYDLTKPSESALDLAEALLGTELTIGDTSAIAAMNRALDALQSERFDLVAHLAGGREPLLGLARHPDRRFSSTARRNPA